MNIQELEDKHFNLPNEPLGLKEFPYKKHTKLSVEFAIEQLEEIDQTIFNILNNNPDFFQISFKIQDKIQELKQYLNE